MEVKKFDPLLQGQTRSWTLKTIPDSENICQNRGVELLCRPCKMKTVASTPPPLASNSKLQTAPFLTYLGLYDIYSP